MDWAWYALLVAILAIGWFVNILGLPGLWIMVAASALYAWATAWQFIGPWVLVVMLGIGLVAELVEFLAGSAGARKVGGSRRAAWGALIGGAAGGLLLALPIPVVGAILGACLGAFIGALVGEFTVHGRTRQSLAVGMGAAQGKLWGILSKLAFSLIIGLIAVWFGMPLKGT